MATPRPAGRDPKLFAGPVWGALLLTLWLLVGTAVYASFAGWTWLDALYMSVISISTVGFHEIHPLTPAGRLFTIVFIMIGLMLVLYTLTSLGQVVFEGELRDILGRRSMEREIATLENHFIVCGFGKVGRPVAEGLNQRGQQVCVVERQADMEPALRDEGLLYVIGDATEEQVLEAAGIARARCLMALLSTDADNLYLTMAAKDFNSGIQVIARADDHPGEVRMRRGGADKVVTPTRIAGMRVLQAALNPAAVEFMELVTDHEGLQLSLADIPVATGSRLEAEALTEAGVRERYGVIVVAIEAADRAMTFNPAADRRIEARETLVVLGADEDLEALQRACG